MIKAFKKLNELYRMLIIASIVAIFLMLLSLILLFAFSQSGWLIGIAIGSVIALINIFLLYKGSEFATKKQKPFIFLLFYFVRMFLFFIGFLLTALFGFGISFKGVTYFEAIPVFYNSIWGVLIAYSPIQVVVILTMFINKHLESKDEIKKGEENNG